jgi:hypothetical protein
MKIDMKNLRWILLGLYGVIIIGLFAIAYTRVFTLPYWLWFFAVMLPYDLSLSIGALLAMVMSQALFVLCLGTTDLHSPVPTYRAFLPVVLTAFMLTVLLAALCCALIDLFDVQGNIYFLWGFLILLALSWIVWSIALFVKYGEKERYEMARKLLLVLIRGSLLELLIAIPSFIIVGTCPGWFPKTLSGFAVSTGVFVMLWAFGPGIIFMYFARETR